MAVFSYADSDVFSPDVQQQTVGGTLLLWGVVTGAALAVQERRSDKHPFVQSPARSLDR